MKLKSRFILVGSAVFLGTSLGINIDSSTAQVPTLSWSQGGPIAGMNCTRIHEDDDIMSWVDNYLCSNQDLGLRWSQSGSIAGMNCTRIHEDDDIPSWVDNYLCSPSNASFILSWSQGGPLPGKACTRIHEDDDIPSWADNYLCMESATTALFPMTGDRDSAVANGRMRTSFTLTSDGRLSAVTNTRTGVQLIGYTGGVSVVLYDESDRPVWASDPLTFGVSGCFVGTCNRTDNWNDTVDPERLNQVKRYEIFHEHNPAWLSRWGRTGEQFLNWLITDAAQGTARFIRTLVTEGSNTEEPSPSGSSNTEEPSPSGN